VSGTKLVNPDFTAWAETFGVKAFPLNMGDDIEAVIKAFLDHKGAALLHVQSSAFALSANGTLPA